MWALPLVGIASAATAAPAASGDFLLRLQVPVLCKVQHHSAIAAAGAGYTLGELHEFCNAPQGYSLVVNYAPGSMRGAVIAVGEERVMLDGSGRAVVSHAQGPRIRDREIYAQPGANGFDTDRLNFSIETN
jgi:hypothetical protein